MRQRGLKSQGGRNFIKKGYRNSKIPNSKCGAKKQTRKRKVLKSTKRKKHGPYTLAKRPPPQVLCNK
jgi:hypothetical protein